MTAVSIRTDDASSDAPRFLAKSGEHQAVGRTMGEALDALMATWKPAASTAVLIRRFGPDEFFTQAQQNRKQALIALGTNRTPDEQQELESLLDAELDATVTRTQSLLDSTQK